MLDKILARLGLCRVNNLIDALVDLQQTQRTLTDADGRCRPFRDREWKRVMTMAQGG